MKDAGDDEDGCEGVSSTQSIDHIRIVVIPPIQG